MKPTWGDLTKYINLILKFSNVPVIRFSKQYMYVKSYGCQTFPFMRFLCIKKLKDLKPINLNEGTASWPDCHISI